MIKKWCTEKFCDKTFEMYGYTVEAESWMEAQKVADKENKGTVVGELWKVIPVSEGNDG